MNINQKIQFLKHRRHIDAMRIKRLKRRFSDVNFTKNLVKAKDFAEFLRSRVFGYGRMRGSGTTWAVNPAEYLSSKTAADAASVLKRAMLKEPTAFNMEQSLDEYRIIKREIKSNIDKIKGDDELYEVGTEKYIKELNKLYQLITEVELSTKMALKYR